MNVKNQPPANVLVNIPAKPPQLSTLFRSVSIGGIKRLEILKAWSYFRPRRTTMQDKKIFIVKRDRKKEEIYGQNIDFRRNIAIIFPVG